LGGEESTAGAINTEEDVPLVHTRKEDLVWFYLTVFVAPLAVLALGFFITRKRATRADAGPSQPAPDNAKRHDDDDDDDENPEPPSSTQALHKGPELLDTPDRAPPEDAAPDAPSQAGDTELTTAAPSLSWDDDTEDKK